MKKLVIDQSKVTKEIAKQLIEICPFGGFDYQNNILDFNAGCKSCGICARKGPVGVVTQIEVKEGAAHINKNEWVGVAVSIEHNGERVHPVSYELIGKARELATKINQPVYAVLIGNAKEVASFTNEIMTYGVDKLFVYTDELYSPFNVELHKMAMVNFLEKIKPGSIIYGATSIGRSFAPRVAAYFRTGLTADCTILDMKENSDLVQIRPAFGGNVMAQIVCPNHRPQMATVRPKIFKIPECREPFGEIVPMHVKKGSLKTSIKVVEIKQKEKNLDISEAEVIVACGRPFKTFEQLKLAEELAELLGGVVGVTRPLIEMGLKDVSTQIGLSGRMVSPKLIINLGISGAIQYTGGILGSETIISINNDPNATIFNDSHYGIIGDVFEIVPLLIEKIKQGRGIEECIIQ